MDRSPLHPLRLLPALLTTPDHGRGHFEAQIEQWLAAQSEGGPAPVTTTSAAGQGSGPAPASEADHAATVTASVPNAGETIPKAGQ